MAGVSCIAVATFRLGLLALKPLSTAMCLFNDASGLDELTPRMEQKRLEGSPHKRWVSVGLTSVRGARLKAAFSTVLLGSRRVFVDSPGFLAPRRRSDLIDLVSPEPIPNWEVSGRAC